MEEEKFIKELQKEAKILNIVCDKKTSQLFYQYMNLLLQWNEKINLTAIKQPIDVLQKHFIDSMTIEKYIKEDDSVIDIGTGAGFPGIPIKLIKPSTNITLVDSLNKRINFLEEVIKSKGLTGIIAIHARAEELGQGKNREKYDVATSRAVASISVLAEYMLPLIKVGGIAICMKGSTIEEEIEKGKKAIKLLGGEIQKTEEITLPNTDMKRNLIIIKKTKKTPEEYPRASAKMAKSPL